MNDILLSIIIPAYNVEKYIKRCLNSIVEQVENQIEIYIINDGSTDNTGAICEQYANKYKYIKVLHKKNEGQSVARNIGICQSCGEYVMFVDSDDFLSEGALNHIINKINTSKPDVLIGLFNNFYQDSKKIEKCNYILSDEVKKSSGSELLMALMKQGTYDWYPVVNIVRRNYLMKNKIFFPEGHFFEDAVWVPQMLYFAKKVDIINLHFYNYTRNRCGATTEIFSKKTYEDKLYACERVDDFMKKEHFSMDNRNRMLGNLNHLYVSLLADSWRLDRVARKQMWNKICKYKSILFFSGRKYQYLLYKLWKFIGIRGVSYILHLRAEWVRRKK